MAGLEQAFESVLKSLATPQEELALLLWLELGGASSLQEAFLTFGQDMAPASMG
jgi:hypothetical protein